LKISYKFVIPNPVNEQAFSGPQSRAGFAREWAELASTGAPNRRGFRVLGWE